MKRRIIIEIRDDELVSEQEALGRVANVMKKGAISNSRGIPHYCWATVFDSGIIVEARQKSSKSSADSFVVFKREAIQ